MDYPINMGTLSEYPRKGFFSKLFALIRIHNKAMAVSVYSLFLALFTIITSIFDIYCLSQEAPDSSNYRYYVLMYEFVFVKNPHVRTCLMLFAHFSILFSIVVVGTSIILINSLRKEHEKKIKIWLCSFAMFTMFRLFALIFYSVVNDLYYSYNVTMYILWMIFTLISLYSWVVIYCIYTHITSMKKLENLVQVKFQIMQAFNVQRPHSVTESRPVTPTLSTASTMPI